MLLDGVCNVASSATTLELEKYVRGAGRELLSRATGREEEEREEEK